VLTYARSIKDVPKASIAPARHDSAVAYLETPSRSRGAKHTPRGVEFDSGTLSLEESIKAYQEGVALVQWSREALAQAQQQVRVLEDQMLKPFKPEDHGS